MRLGKQELEKEWIKENYNEAYNTAVKEVCGEMAMVKTGF